MRVVTSLKLFCWMLEKIILSNLLLRAPSKCKLNLNTYTYINTLETCRQMFVAIFLETLYKILVIQSRQFWFPFEQVLANNKSSTVWQKKSFVTQCGGLFEVSNRNFSYSYKIKFSELLTKWIELLNEYKECSNLSHTSLGKIK